MYPQPHIGLGNGFDEQAKMLSDNGRIIVLAVPGDKIVLGLCIKDTIPQYQMMDFTLRYQIV